MRQADLLLEHLRPSAALVAEPMEEDQLNGEQLRHAAGYMYERHRLFPEMP